MFSLIRLVVVAVWVAFCAPLLAQISSTPSGITPNWVPGAAQAKSPSSRTSATASMARSAAGLPPVLYSDTSLLACPVGEKLKYFYHYLDVPAYRATSWCGAAQADIDTANIVDAVERPFRLPYILESCTPGVEWLYSHNLDEGGRFYSPPVRAINMVCEELPHEISISGPAIIRPGNAGGQRVQFIATVTQGGAPKEGVAVTFSSQLTTAGGGFGIPVGAVTDAQGIIWLSYSPPPTISGTSKTDRLSANCLYCSNSAQAAIVVIAPPPTTDPESCEDSGVQSGRPILLATGTKILTEIDNQDRAPHALELVRHYASLWATAPTAGLGASWGHNHAHYVDNASAATPSSRSIVFGDGSVSRFANTAAQVTQDPNQGGSWSCTLVTPDTPCSPPPPAAVDPALYPPIWQASGSLDTLRDTPTGIELRRNADDSVWLFSKTTGAVISQQQRNGWSYTYAYHPSGQLASVTNQFGRSLTLAYNSARQLVSSTAPDGQVTSYAYDSLQRLSSAQYTNNTAKNYVYENTDWPQAVTGIVDENGTRFSNYSYDSEGRATLSELAGGAERTAVAYGYSTIGSTQQSTVYDALGNARIFQYQASSGAASGMRTKGASAPTGSGADYAVQSFNTSGLHEQRTDFLGNTTVYGWDAIRRLSTEVTRAWGLPEAQTDQTQWHPAFRLPVLVNQSGIKSTAYTYDSVGNKRTEASTDLATGQTRVWQWAYNTAGLPATSTDPLGRVTRYSYDAWGNLASITNPLGQISTMAYDAAGRLLSITVPNGLQTTSAYDVRGRMVRSVRGANLPAAQQQITAYTHTPSGQLASAQMPNGHQVAYTYDVAQRLVAAADNRGNRISYTLDGAGNRIVQEHRDANNTIALVTRRVINTLGKVAELSTGNPPETARMIYDYDANGEQTSSVDRLSNVTLISLDALRRPVSILQRNVRDSPPPPPPPGEFRLSAAAASSAPTAAPAATGKTQHQYNQLDQLTAAIDPKGVQTSYAKNAWGEVLSETSPDTGAMAYTRDIVGNVISKTDALGKTTAYAYDALDRVTQITQADGKQQLFAYDGASALGGTGAQTGYLREITDNSGTTRYDRDLFGRILKKTQTVNTAAAFVDVVGNVNGTATPIGGLATYATQYAYNQAGELAQLTYPSGLNVYYRRNATGQITALDTQAPGRNKPTVPFVSGISYNALQQPTAWNWAHCGSSPTVGLTSTSCANATRTYDSAGRMSANELASYQFDAASRITGITQNLWASLVTTSTFSSTASGTVSTVVTSNTSYYQTPISWSIGYDARSRVTSFNRILPNTLGSANSANGNSSTAYSYNANSNRLTSINKKIADSDLDGDFDQADRAQTVAQGLSVDPGSNKLLGFNQSTTTTRGTRTLSTVDTQVNYALDAAGNLTSDGLRVFSYDANNRHMQTSIGSSSESSKITYLHNALGQRVFKSEPQVNQTAPDETTLGTPFVEWLKKNFGWLFAAGQVNATLGQTYLYADGQLPDYAMLGEYGNGAASGSGRTEYIYLPTDSGAAIPVGIFRSNRLFAVHTDHLSTPRQITDDTNKTVWQWTYSAFGDNKPTGIHKATVNPNNAYTQDPTTNARLQATNPALAYNPRFAGQYFDSESNLNQNFNRSYAPNVGAYTQMDPIGLGGGMNRRGYVGGNAVMNTDPSGLQKNGGRANNARDAAGYHDPRGDFSCQEWSCPENSDSCSRKDQRSPTDFLPSANKANNPPAGCTCTRLGYQQDWSQPTPEERDIADAYNKYKEGKELWPRVRDGLGKLPIWHRLGGYAK